MVIPTVANFRLEIHVVINLETEISPFVSLALPSNLGYLQVLYDLSLLLFGFFYHYGSKELSFSDF